MTTHSTDNIKVTRMFPQSLLVGTEMENMAIFAARRCRTVKTHNELTLEVIHMTDFKKRQFIQTVVFEDWALDVLEIPYLVYDFESVPMWLVIEFLRHRHIMRDFSMEQLSQRAINSDKLKLSVPEPMIEVVDDYLSKIHALAKEYHIPPEELRKSYPQGVEVNFVLAGNVRAWQHLFYMRASEHLGGKGGAHPQFKALADEAFRQAVEVYPVILNRGIIPA